MDFATIASTYGSNFRPFPQNSLCVGTSQSAGVCLTLVSEYVSNRGNVSSLLSTWMRRWRQVLSDVSLSVLYDNLDYTDTVFGRNHGKQAPDRFALEATRVLAKAPSGFIGLWLYYPRGNHLVCFHVRNRSVTLFDPNHGFLDLALPVRGDSEDQKREKLGKVVGALREYIHLVNDLAGELANWELQDIHAKSAQHFLARA
jgi:hypothetical protein